MTSKFWLLEAPENQPRAEIRDAEYEQITCPTHEGHRRAGKRLGDLSVIVHPLGARDFTWIWGGRALISRRVLNLFDKYGVTGFEAKPVRVFYREAIKPPAPEMFQLLVTGWGGLAAPAAGVSLIEWCPACRYKRYAIAEPSRLIDPAAWDGSDLFIVWPLPGLIFASDRLADILRQERVSGLKLIPAPMIWVKKGGTASPGSLMRRMPERRARELDQRFGVSDWLVPRS